MALHRERTLLQWIANPTHLVRSPASRVEAVVESIRENLERVLNSRIDSAPACPEYGMPQPIGGLISNLGAVSALEQDLERVIQKLEPRLTNVVVRQVASAANAPYGMLHFRIQGQLLNSVTLQLHARCDGDGFALETL
jgi:type VI secretion system lysozyme-like protein